MEFEDQVNMHHIPKVDLLSKLTTVFDQLTPIDNLMQGNEATKRQLIHNMKGQEKTIEHLIFVKDKFRDHVKSNKITPSLTNQDNNEAENELIVEPLTSNTYKGSFATMTSSEQVPPSATSLKITDLGQGGIVPHIVQDKHLLTLVKMIETILTLLQQDTSKSTIEKASKDVQVNIQSGEGEMSARERQRLSLEERIRARKSAVQDSNDKQKDLELKNLRYDIEMLQQKMISLKDDKAMSEIKVQEQELNIQEQFEIIQDYSTEIQELQERNDKYSEKIRELESQIQKLENMKGANQNNSETIPIKTDNVDVDKKPTENMADKIKQDNKEKNVEVMSNNINDIQQSVTNAKENAENGKNNHFNPFATSFHVTDNVRVSMSVPKLTEDMLQINEDLQAMTSPSDEMEQIQTEPTINTPAQALEKIDESSTTALDTAQTQVETIKSTTDASCCDEKPLEQSVILQEIKDKEQKSQPNEEKKQKGKKEKGSFEFPEGGWECSKCQNYNFKGRKECNRCKKVRSKQDLTGKPLHLLKTDQKEKDAPSGLKLQRVKMQKNSKFKNLKVDTNLANTERQVETQEAPLIVQTGLQSAKQKSTVPLTKESKKGGAQQERAGDWVCQRCNNHNFSFRSSCYMCHLSQEASAKMGFQQNSNLNMNKCQTVPSSATNYNSQPQLGKNNASSAMGAQQFMGLPQNGMRDRVVHVHQYFNTYQVQPQQYNGNSNIQRSMNNSMLNNQNQNKTQGQQVAQSTQPSTFTTVTTKTLPQWRPSTNNSNTQQASTASANTSSSAPAK